MDRKFFQLVGILLVAVLGYSILSTPGSQLTVNITQLKNLLMYVLLGACAYAFYATIKPPRRPPGV